MDLHHSGRGRHPRFQLPQIPDTLWCEARRMYEQGMSLREIGLRFHCDPRTVKACILRNSDELGRKNTARILQPYENFIRDCLSGGYTDGLTSIGAISRKIYVVMKERIDYTGSEKTVRNYLYTLLPAEVPASPDDELPLGIRETGHSPPVRKATDTIPQI